MSSGKKKTPSTTTSASTTPSTLSPSGSSATVNAAPAAAAASSNNNNGGGLGVPPIGFSIGSAYSCAAFFKDGRSQVVPNEDGERVTPSCVAFTDKEMFAGTAAKSQWVRNRQNTLVDFAHLLGLQYSEITEEEKKDWAHKVIEKNGKPVFEVEYKGETQQFTPEDITSFMIKKMKETTEMYLGVTVKEVSLSVPLRATEEYKKALVVSAEKVGLKVSALVKEPVASLLNFGIGQVPEQFFTDRNVLIFDLGGLFLDITIISSFGGLYEIIYSSSEKLGGKDYDLKLTEHFAKEFERKNKAEIRSNAKAVSKLRFVAENTRRTLSNSPTAQISVESVHDGIDFHSSINRSMFDMVTGSLNRSTLAAVQKGLEATGLEVSDIQEVLLVGGGTSMLGVQKLIEAFFPDSTIRKDVAPEEYIACGVAFQASVLAGQSEGEVQDQFTSKALPSTIGVSDGEGNLVPLLKKRCPVPAKRSATFTLTTEGQTSALLSVYAGENKIAKENVHLADLILTGLHAASEKAPLHIEVSITVEESLQVKLTAVEKTSKKIVQAVIPAQ